MTEKLYDKDAYATEFDAAVTAVSACDEQDGMWVTLSATLFFPEEGGQSPDRGTIDGCEVTDVQITGGEIRHRIRAERKEDWTVGRCVHGCIDREFRYRNMQMHTGEHIFSGLVYARYGYHNVGFHLSERTATMDYDGKLTEDQLRELETAANRAIVENRAVTAWYASAEELAAREYRSKKAIDGAVRLVEIDGIDLCACCAPHVRATGEVGCFKLIGWENYKGGVRVSYRCGFRAMEDYGERLALLTNLSRQLSVKTEDLADAVSKLMEERKDAVYAVIEKDRRIALSEITATVGRDARPRTEDGRINGAGVLFLAQADASLLRYSIDEMKRRYAGVVCALLPVEMPEIAEGAGVWRFVIEQDGGDVTQWIAKLRERFGAKGGGPDNSVQGSVRAQRRALALVLAELCEGRE